MSRNDAKKDTSGFRKIDIDQYNDNNFKEEEDGGTQGSMGLDENTVMKFLRSYPFQNCIF